jgi:hypothetical protein
MADPDREFDAIVIGEYERAFCGSQYALMAPLFGHYSVQLWMPEAGSRVDLDAEGDEQLMISLGVQSKREITRTKIRVRTAMAAQARDQGRYLGGRPPYGYRLADAGPHSNRAHAAWGRRAWRLEPDPLTAPVVRWMLAHRRAGRAQPGPDHPAAGDLNPHGGEISPDRGNHHAARIQASVLLTQKISPLFPCPLRAPRETRLGRVRGQSSAYIGRMTACGQAGHCPVMGSVSKSAQYPLWHSGPGWWAGGRRACNGLSEPIRKVLACGSQDVAGPGAGVP